jgi:hypothetical protein
VNDFLVRVGEPNFPQLSASGYSITSADTVIYNCIAHAAGYSNAWWWPTNVGGYFWPAGVVKAETLDAFIEAFGTLGFEKCDSGAKEDGYEKVAIYTKNDRPTHAARQLSSGTWTSKLGRLEDIEHASLGAIEGPMYGVVACFMRRPAP